MVVCFRFIFSIALFFRLFYVQTLPSALCFKVPLFSIRAGTRRSESDCEIDESWGQ
jgi:hypothetical protein